MSIILGISAGPSAPLVEGPQFGTRITLHFVLYSIGEIVDDMSRFLWYRIL